MSDIGEVAKSIEHQLDPMASGSLESLLAAAKERAADNAVNVTTLIEGSDNPAAEALQGRVQKVATALGALQQELVLIQGTKDTLLAIWGIGDSNAPAAYTVQNSNAEVAMPAEGQASQPRLWQRSIEGIIGDMGLSGREKGMASMVRATLAFSGLRTVADVLAVGRDKLGNVRMGDRMGEPKLVALQAIVHYAYPETNIPERADPALTAQTHDSLARVPWLAVANNKRLYDAAYLLQGKQISVQDVLTKTRQELFGNHIDDGEFAVLRQDALDYAIAFSTAKRRSTR